jgi:LysR family transcriptional regulator, hydrogen peroxide-inducible genes activator
VARPRPSIRQLECAVAVADALHFGRAARAIALTQPALSAQIRSFEELLGLRLFERGRRGVIVTTGGAAVIEQARATLAALDDLVESAASQGEPLSGTLRLGVIPTVAPYLLPPLLPFVRRKWPKLRLVLREDQTARLLEQLALGTLDLLLLALPVEQAAVEELPLLEEPFWFVAPSAHRLAKVRGTIAEATLAGEEILLLEDGHCLRAQALEVCRRAGAAGPGRIQATSLPTLVQMVANGLGVTLLPERALAVELRPDAGLVARRFEKPAPSRTLGLAWRPGAARAAEYRLLGQTLAQALASRGRGKQRR